MSGRFLLLAAALAGSTGCGLIGYDELDGGGGDGGSPDAGDNKGPLPLVGEPDPDFGTAGEVPFNYVDDDGGSLDDQATAVAVDSQGRLVVAVSGNYRSYQAGDPEDMASITMRLLPDGSLDPTYQSGAQSVPGTTVDHTSTYSHINGLILTEEDDVVGCGYREFGGSDDPIAYRYTAVGGQPDNSFGTAGVARVPVAGEGEIFGCALDPTDGRYLMTGSRYGDYVIVTKQNPTDGSPVTEFGSAGVLSYDITGDETGEAIAVDDKGRLYIVGRVTNGGASNDLRVWCYTPDGTLDPLFNDDGIFVFETAGDERALAAAIDDEGNLLVTGEVDGALVVFKLLTASGTLDPSFGDAGIFSFNPATGTAVGEGIAIAGDGIWVTGQTGKQGGSTMGLWKLTEAGQLDVEFMGGSSTQPGLLTWDFTGDYASGFALVRLEGGVVVVGEARGMGETYTDAAVWKIR